MRTMTIAALLIAAAVSTPAKSVDFNQYATVPGGLCKPAGTPATNPGSYFAAKAIGGRNEGTSNVFVICPFLLTPTPMEGGVVTELNLQAYAIDGTARDLTCTAVIGSIPRVVNATYSTKTMSVPGGEGAVFKWTAADFGGTSGDGIPGSAWATITCLTPPQLAIGMMYAKLNPRIQ